MSAENPPDHVNTTTLRVTFDGDQQTRSYLSAATASPPPGGKRRGGTEKGGETHSCFSCFLVSNFGCLSAQGDIVHFFVNVQPTEPQHKPDTLVDLCETAVKRLSAFSFSSLPQHREKIVVFANCTSTLQGEIHMITDGLDGSAWMKGHWTVRPAGDATTEDKKEEEDKKKKHVNQQKVQLNVKERDASSGVEDMAGCTPPHIAMIVANDGEQTSVDLGNMCCCDCGGDDKDNSFIDDVRLVINYDLPAEIQGYTSRIAAGCCNKQQHKQQERRRDGGNRGEDNEGGTHSNKCSCGLMHLAAAPPAEFGHRRRIVVINLVCEARDSQLIGDIQKGCGISIEELPDTFAEYL